MAPCKPPPHGREDKTCTAFAHETSALPRPMAPCARSHRVRSPSPHEAGIAPCAPFLLMTTSSKAPCSKLYTIFACCLEMELESPNTTSIGAFFEIRPIMISNLRTNTSMPCGWVRKGVTIVDVQIQAALGSDDPPRPRASRRRPSAASDRLGLSASRQNGGASATPAPEGAHKVHTRRTSLWSTLMIHTLHRICEPASRTGHKQDHLLASWIR